MASEAYQDGPVLVLAASRSCCDHRSLQDNLTLKANLHVLSPTNNVSTEPPRLPALGAVLIEQFGEFTVGLIDWTTRRLSKPQNLGFPSAHYLPPRAAHSPSALRASSGVSFEALAARAASRSCSCSFAKRRALAQVWPVRRI